MSEEELVLQGNAYDNFVNTIKSKATRKLYNFALKNFMVFRHIGNVDDLLAWQPRIIEANIASWMVHLREKEKLSPTTIKCYLAAVMFFYSMNDVEPRRKKLAHYLPEEQANEDRGYTHEEIARLLHFCDYRTKALVLLLASGGMRIGAVTELKLKHLVKIDKYNLYKVKVYAGFPKHEHYTFTTPEAAIAVDTYLQFRQRYGEKIAPDSPVFREQFDIEDQIIARHPKKMQPNNLGDIIGIALQKAGIFEKVHMMEGEKHGRKRNVIPRAHGFRKFFETNLIRAKIHDPIPELLMGHDIGLKKSYWRPDEDEILEEYVKAVDLLTINEENRLRKKVQEMTRQDDRLDGLQAQIEELGRKLGLGS